MDQNKQFISPTEGFEASQILHHEATEYLAGGVSSNFRLGGPVPIFYSHALGSKLYSADERTYLDYVLGMGAVILGHAPARVIQKVSECLGSGQLYGGEHKAEQILARMICSVVPCAERVRFGCSGSEVIQAALRVARAFTGRQKIVKFEGHYHGWFDNIYVGVHPQVYGAPEPESAGQMAAAFQDTLVLPWNNIDALESELRANWREIAAVIMEPVLCNTSVIMPRPGYLEEVRELCSRFGVVLIFDEVIAGFRVGLSGAQGLLGVTPDLVVFAKAMAAGFPISCLCGKAELMELIGSGRVMHGGTFNTNVPSVTAAIATLEELGAGDGAVYGSLYQRGEQLMCGLRSIAKTLGVPLLVQGLGPVFHCAFTGESAITDYRSYQGADEARLSKFLRALLYRGVRVTGRGTWFLSTAHTDQDIETTLDIASDALQEIA
jgi:glutamate-1-semialdehyde 2,1-aminomutase